MNETWKKIEGYEKWYEVSNLGRIKVLAHVDGKGKHHDEKIATLTLNRQTGYLSICLVNRDCIPVYFKRIKYKIFKVHRLVACAFHGNNLHLFVNHKDGDRANNNADNLEWVTPHENYIDGENRRRKEYFEGPSF